MGERAEISWKEGARVSQRDMGSSWEARIHTKDLRYDSKDSRDIEKGSFSQRRVRWLEETVEVGDLPQKLFFSGGDGCS